ncbi:hypothetical protein CMALT430_170056 [Carnobacterium maltaromaticum]|nr:hypothetical protein CMALT430_170056 [Carnobacterium maltaromaticum]
MILEGFWSIFGHVSIKNLNNKLLKNNGILCPYNLHINNYQNKTLNFQSKILFLD